MIRNPNPIWIQDNDESPSTTRNPNLTRTRDVTRNPSPTRIQDVIMNPYPTRIEYPLTYDGVPITWACAKKMKKALDMLIQAIWAQSTNLKQSDPFGVCGVHSGLKLIHLVEIEDLGLNNIFGSNLDTLRPKGYTCSKPKHVLFSLISFKNEFGFVSYPKHF